MRKLPWLELAILAVSVAILVALAYATQRANDESVESIDSYSSYDTRSGGFRAWYDVLARVNLAVDRFEFHPALLDHGIGSLVYAEPLAFDPRQSEESEADVHALDAWVKNGGNLLYIGHDEAAAHQNILGLPVTTVPKGGGALAIAPSLHELGIADLRPKTKRRYHHKKGGVELIRDAGGDLIERYAYGKGTVTVVADESLFTNDRLGLGDHARLAVALIPKGPVAFDEWVHGYETPLNWWDLVPRPLVISFLIGVAAIAVAIVGGAIRLGPPLVPRPRDDRTSADFLDSVGGLYMRGGATHKAVVDAWISTRRAAALRVGLPDDAPVEDIAARVESPDIGEGLLRLQTIAASPEIAQSNLVAGIALAQRLRKDLVLHGR